MLNGKIGVGIIGASPGKGWASATHVPAIKSLPAYELRAVCTSRRESAHEAKRVFGVSLAFDHYDALIARPEIDLVVVAVRVPRHFEIVAAAIAAGKSVYCEWPLANGLEEAVALTDAARTKGVANWVGLQLRASPTVLRIRDLIREGYIGEVLSTTLVGSGLFWGGQIDEQHAFIVDKRNGVTPLSISCAHRMDALCYCLGEFDFLSATLANRRTTARVIESGAVIPKTSEDQIAVNGSLTGGAVASVHYRGGVSRGVNLLWEINGTDGDLQIVDPAGLGQMHDLQLWGGRGTAKSLQPLTIPIGYFHADAAAVPGVAYNVGQNYSRLASDIRDGTRFCATFADALVRHRMLDAIERSSLTGGRQRYPWT